MKEVPRPTMTIPQFLEAKKYIQRAAIRREIYIEVKPKPKPKADE